MKSNTLCVLLLVMLACCGQANAAAVWFGDPGDAGQLARDLQVLDQLLGTREVERDSETGVKRVDCASNPCKNDASCFDEVNLFRCICPAEFTGTTCALEMEEGLSEVSLTGKTELSSSVTSPALAVDGNAATCSRTGHDDDNPGWGVHLDSRTEYRCIRAVEIINAANDTSGYLQGAKVLPVLTGSELTTASPCGQPVTAEQAAVPGAVLTFKCDPPRKAWFLAVMGNPQTTLQVCEVRAWELPVEKCKDNCQSGPCKNGATCVNGLDQFTCTCAAGFTGTMCEIDLATVEPGQLVIVDKPTRQSSTYTNHDLGIPFPSNLAVDGNTNTNPPLGKSCAHTDIQSNPWWYVDLGENHAIKLVKIVNRFDSRNSVRLAGARVFVESQVDDPLNIASLTNVCGSPVTKEQAEGGGGIVPIECNPPINGRYVVIMIPRDEYLQLCEVMIWEDIDECKGDPCENGGTCVHGVDTFSCKCAAGYTGTTCETDIDECEPNPCRNGANCVDGVNQFTCTCLAGFTGSTCEENIDECESSPCKNGGTCEDGVYQFTCTCAAGFNGLSCEEKIDRCLPNPCKNGASCKDGIDHLTCLCVGGFTGPTCETDINECEGDPCKNGGTCTHGVNTFACKCAAGYTGTTCETDIECEPSPCKNGGTCHNGVNQFTCTCAAGFTGLTCETESNPCQAKPCQQGICLNKPNGFTCQCSPGFGGELCEIDIDECNSRPCQHGGECIDGINEVTCVCPSGYTGVLCETKIAPVAPLPHLPSSGNIQVSAIQLRLSVEYCIRKIVVHTHGACTSDRLTGAVIHGGRGPFGYFDGVCGVPLTAKRALEQHSFIDFICDPPLSANYITMNLPSAAIPMPHLCEITVQESTPGPC